MVKKNESTEMSEKVESVEMGEVYEIPEGVEEKGKKNGQVVDSEATAAEDSALSKRELLSAKFSSASILGKKIAVGALVIVATAAISSVVTVIKQRDRNEDEIEPVVEETTES